MRPILKVKYLGPTDHKGARLSIEDMQEQKRTIISRDYSVDSYQQVKRDYKALHIFDDKNISYFEVVG
jgi:hypothetical protein